MTKLIITNFDADYSSIIKANNSSDIIWLQLWPVSNINQIINNFPQVRIVKLTDFINNDNHYEIANKVTEISENWWNLLGLDKFQKEWEIEGLKISQIFSYEIEQVLTNLMFQIIAINKVIEKYKPSTMLFIEKNKNLSSNTLTNTRLIWFYKNNSKNIQTEEEIINHEVVYKHKKFLIINKIKNITIDKVLKKFKPNKLKKGSVIISNSNRCLHKFDEIISKKEEIFILNDSLYKEESNLNISLPEFSEDVFFNGVSLNPFFNSNRTFLESKFTYLSALYESQILLINKYNPKIYITVNVADSNEIVKLWAFKNKGIRVVLAAEGIGHPDDKIILPLKSVLHPELNIEWWVISKFYFNYFNSRYNNKLKITGYLDRNITKERIDNKKTKKKKIIYVLSIINPEVRRAILGEDMFEMLQSVVDVAKVVNDFSDYELIIRLHPGDNDKIKLFNEYIKQYKNVKLSIFDNLNSIIDESSIVIIYDTSVGLESLYRRKNVICYNYTNLPSYITSIYEYVNHNPERGAALIMTHTKEELKKEIERLLSYADNNKRSPGLEYVLENAREDYNVEEIIKKLFENQEI